MKKLFCLFALLLTAAAATAAAAGVEPAGLVPGTYAITVESSASMFRVVDCRLTADGASFTARMTMSGKGYGYLYPGTAEEAAALATEAWIPRQETDGSVVFDFPVPALDVPVSCAAYSIKKDQWYDRTLIFRSEGISPEAFTGGLFVTAESLGLADGVYRAEAALSGGSGRAFVQSPAEITVEGGEATALVVMSSDKYDYMRIGETVYPPVGGEGPSAFRIPVPCFDRPFTVFADTTAMSVPHEIEYTLTFSSEGLR